MSEVNSRPNRRKLKPGDTFDRLTVISRRREGRAQKCLCRCECGTEKEYQVGHLLSGHTHSCGCHRRDTAGAQSVTHGATRNRTATRTYGIWCNMLNRCRNPNVPAYSRYGGSGIKVCDRWQDFANFLADMGEPPTAKHTLDRYPDNNGHYEPGNCRWATMKEQNRNRGNNRMITYDGRTQCLAAWAEETGFTSLMIGQRLKNQWPVERALTEQPNPKRVAAGKRGT